MKGTIPKRPVTSVNNYNPDANGNVSGLLTVDTSGSSTGTGATINADTLAGMTVAQLKASIKTSEISNDAGFITAATAPVTSYNGRTGSIVPDPYDNAGLLSLMLRTASWYDMPKNLNLNLTYTAQAYTASTAIAATFVNSISATGTSDYIYRLSSINLLRNIGEFTSTWIYGLIYGIGLRGDIYYRHGRTDSGTTMNWYGWKKLHNTEDFNMNLVDGTLYINYNNNTTG